MKRCRPSPSAALALLATLVLVGAAGCVPLTPYAEVRQELPDEHFLRIGGRDVYARSTGRGETVLLVHGFGASSYTWRHLVPELARAYRVVTLDLHGFGYTERPGELGAYTRSGQVDLLFAVLDALGTDRAHLVGHSYGGAVVQAAAARRPERVRSLTLVASTRSDYPQARRRTIARFRPLMALWIRGLALRESRVRSGLEQTLWDDSLVTEELVEGYLAPLRIEGVVRAYQGLTVPIEELEAEPVDLSAIAAPTLVVWGEDDPLISVEMGKRATSVMPCHRFVALPRTGHLPMEERPEELAELLHRFFDDPGAVCR